ncbi:hypothetical protein R3P38DRAFT_2778862 [Favolaschia claudopus]|uniref:Tetraspanin n=1 Tax=Favolaschia claudopus TaxID=2862362 RepID=A0AAW0BFA4_9AGAR
MPLYRTSSSQSSAPSSFPRRRNSQVLSWIEPEDYEPSNPTAMLDPSMSRSRLHERERSVSFGAASSLMGASETTTRAASPFGLNPGEGTSSLRTSSALALHNLEHRASASLSVNYTPAKFSDALVFGGPRRRRRGEERTPTLPTMARGGGVDAFGKGAARMPDDRDDLHPTAHRRGLFERSEMRGRWTRFKTVLFIVNIVYSTIALTALVGMILIWLDILENSDVIRVANRTELVFSTLAASVAVFTAVFGWVGVLLNNRSILAFYCFFLWFSFAFLVTPGYLTYRRANLNLEGKLNFEWSRLFDINARRRIQNVLHCCGYFNPFVEASISSTCYARSVLPGCKGPYLKYQRALLKKWYIIIFSLVAVHLVVIVASLLCSNHVTYRFGKGMMPKAYRLDEAAVAVIMDNYAACVFPSILPILASFGGEANPPFLLLLFPTSVADSRYSQLAEDYGPEAAAAFVTNTHSRAGSTVDLSDLHSMPMDPMGVASSSSTLRSGNTSSGPRYGTIGGTKPDTAI